MQSHHDFYQIDLRWLDIRRCNGRYLLNSMYTQLLFVFEASDKMLYNYETLQLPPKVYIIGWSYYKFYSVAFTIYVTVKKYELVWSAYGKFSIIVGWFTSIYQISDNQSEKF